MSLLHDAATLFGFGDFFSADGVVQAARPVVVAETADAHNDQTGHRPIAPGWDIAESRLASGQRMGAIFSISCVRRLTDSMHSRIMLAFKLIPVIWGMSVRTVFTGTIDE